MDRMRFIYKLNGLYYWFIPGYCADPQGPFMSSGEARLDLVNLMEDYYDA